MFKTVLSHLSPHAYGLQFELHFTFLCKFRPFFLKVKYLIAKVCQDNSVVRFVLIDPMVSGSNPLSAKLSLRVRRAASSL